LGIYGFYEFLVTFFGVVNVPSMFKILMNLVFHEKLDEFVIIYIDDMFVYSKTIKKHMTHLDVLNKLKKNHFFSNKANNEFAPKKRISLGMY